MQAKSGSFRKTAKHWSICSPRENKAAQRKLSMSCMFVPRVMEQVWYLGAIGKMHNNINHDDDEYNYNYDDHKYC